jgi:FMN-dependent NADH-azoreductase
MASPRKEPAYSRRCTKSIHRTSAFNHCVQSGNNDVPRWLIITRRACVYLDVAKQGATTMNILHIDSSILGANSITRSLSALTVERLVAAHPGARVEYRDLGASPIGHLTGEEFAARGKAADPVLEQFKAADIVVIGSPMYNWTISSQLKAWIDRVAVAGETFGYSAEGPKGRAGGKQVIVLTGRGSSLLDKRYTGLDHQEPYLRAVFRFLGIDDVTFVHAQGLALSVNARPAVQAKAEAEIERLFAVQRRAA